jgi:hypothetical protein
MKARNISEILIQFGYPFEWLDETVEITLNPLKNDVSLLDHEQLQLIMDRVSSDTRKVISNLKSQAFYLCSADEIKILVGQYHHAIRILIDQTREIRQHGRTDEQFQHTVSFIRRALGELNEQLYNRYADYLPKQSVSPKKNEPAPEVFKILCKLSVDQIGIILKAADDTKLIIAKSLSLIFKTVVPFLSTDKKMDLSWDSMRSNSYHPEEGDKIIAIEALNRMINTIKEY